MMKLISWSWIMMNLISKKDLRKEKKKVVQKRSLIDTSCESNINTFIWKKYVGLAHFLAPSLKIFPPKNFLHFFLRKPTLKKNFFLIFQEMELSDTKIESFLIFSQNIFFLYFRKRNFLASSLKIFTFMSLKNKKNSL